MCLVLLDGYRDNLCRPGKRFGLARVDPLELLVSLYATDVVLCGVLPVEVGDGEHLTLLIE